MNTHITVGSSLFRECNPHDYTNPSEPWSLQNAVLYTASCFIDKSQTKNKWFKMLDPKYTSLSSDFLDDIIKYAVYDCLSVTYLRLPVLQRWSLIQLEKTPIHILLTDSKEVISDPDLEYISDDELPQVIQPSSFDNNQQQRQYEVNDEASDLELIIECPTSFEQNSSILNTYVSKKHSQRSAEARARRNKKRSIAHRLQRYKYYLNRSLYHRFNMKMIKKILDEFKIEPTHIKYQGNQLMIGIKNAKLKEKYEKLLPIDIFDRNHYYRY